MQRMLLQEAPTRSELERDALPPWAITQAEFDGLLEYSASLPTGVYDGKTWKCNLHFRQVIYQGLDPFGTPMIRYLDFGPACWIVVRYEPHSPGKCIVRRYRPVIVPEKDAAA